MSGPEAATKAPPEERASVMGALVRRASLSAGVLTAIAYVLLRSFCDLFYAPPGLSPEEVGLDQAALLGRAVGVLIFAISIGVALLVWVIPNIRRRQSQDRVKRPWWAVAVAVALAVLTGWISDSEGIGFFAFIGTYAVLGVAVDIRHIDWKDPRVARVALVFITVVAIITTVTYGFIAIEDRKAVQDGRGLAGSDRFFAPWEATLATVTWTGAQPTPRVIQSLGCGIYLGSNGDTSFVFDPKEDKTLHIPAGAAIIRSQDSEDFICKDGQLRTR
jgi:hypothetical protein